MTVCRPCWSIALHFQMVQATTKGTVLTGDQVSARVRSAEKLQLRTCGTPLCQAWAAAKRRNCKCRLKLCAAPGRGLLQVDSAGQVPAGQADAT